MQNRSTMLPSTNVSVRLAPRWRRALSLVVVFCVAASVLTVATQSTVPSAQAADARLFDPGNIVSDAVFYDGGAMNADGVQAYLSARVPSCSSSYACLTTFRQNTPTLAAVPGRCAAYSGGATESAATIIAKVGAACGISQKAIIVLLEKEQGLVTSPNPSQSRFDHATGFGCPDTAPCDPNVAGFFYQIYYAAKQFKVYQTSPGSFNYRAGQSNTILYNPNRACGSSSVYVVNSATAGLYNYTPYQPNAAAMANLGGTGDSCSSYGNRNFFVLYSDWFGSPVAGSSLIRTADSPNIWLTSGSVKYLIPDASLLASFSVLGQVAYVSQSFVDSFSTAQNATNIIRSASGSIFFHDASIKLGMTSCALVVDYGGSCALTGYTQLTDYQVSQFSNGPTLTNLFATITGGKYYIAGGVKHEVLDDRSKAAANLTGDYPYLTEGAISGLPYGTPVTRDSVFIRNSGTGAYSLLTAGTLHQVPSGTENQYGIPPRTAGSLTPASLATLPLSTPFDGTVQTTGVPVALGPSAAYPWQAGIPALTSPMLPISAELMGSYPVQIVPAGAYIKSVSSAAVYVVTAPSVRAASSWQTLVTIAGTPNVAITTLPDSIVAQLSQGMTMLQPGSLVKNVSSPAVFLIDGMNSILFVGDFAMTSAAGVEGYTTVSDGLLAGYREIGSVGYVYRCNGIDMLAASGSLHAMSAVVASAFGIAAIPAEATTCSMFPKGGAESQFIRTPNGAIFQIAGGQRHPIASMARYLQLDATGSNYINVDDGLLGLLPAGSPA